MRPLQLGDGFAGAPAGLLAPLERFNREIGRHTDVVGIVPDDQSLIRLVSMLAIEANDAWLVGRGYIVKHAMDSLLEERPSTRYRGGTRAHSGLRGQNHHDDMSALLVHHVPGLH